MIVATQQKEEEEERSSSGSSSGRSTINIFVNSTSVTITIFVTNLFQELAVIHTVEPDVNNLP